MDLEDEQDGNGGTAESALDSLVGMGRLSAEAISLTGDVETNQCILDTMESDLTRRVWKWQGKQLDWD